MMEHLDLVTAILLILQKKGQGIISADIARVMLVLLKIPPSRATEIIEFHNAYIEEFYGPPA